MDTATTPAEADPKPGTRLPYLTPPPRAGERLRCTWSEQRWWTVGAIYPVSPGPALLDDDGDICPIGRDSFRGAYAPRFERL